VFGKKFRKVLSEGLLKHLSSISLHQDLSRAIMLKEVVPRAHSCRPGTRCWLKSGVYRRKAPMPANQMRIVTVKYRHVNRGCSFQLVGLHPRQSAVNVCITANKGQETSSLSWNRHATVFSIHQKAFQKLCTQMHGFKVTALCFLSMHHTIISVKHSSQCATTTTN